MTNDELFTPFAITHFHEGTHSNADHPDAVDVANVRRNSINHHFPRCNY